MAFPRHLSAQGDLKTVRDFLTILALILVVVLSAALAVPYLVDWNAERSLVEAQLSNLLGQQVKIRGGIDLKLLPTPYLQLADVEVADPAAGTDIRAAELHLEIALAALMRGEVDFVEARLVRPQLRLRIDNESLRLPVLAHDLSGQQMQFERISVEDGSVAIDDPATGRSFTFTNIALAAEARALTGPFTGDGRFEMAGEPTAFRFSTGERQGEQLHFKLIVDENQNHPRADVDANLIFAPRNLPSISGAIELAGHMRDPLTLPWQLSGSLHADLRKATISNLDLHVGDEDHLASFGGAAEFDLGRKPRADLTIKAQQIDLDKLLSSDGMPPAMQRVADIFSSLAKSNDLAPLNVPVALDLSADSILLGGETLDGVSAALAVSGKASASLRIEANGPGGSHLSADGSVETGIAPGFTGRIDASADDVPHLRVWLSGNLPQIMPAALTLPIRSFAISGTANISEIGFVGSDLSLGVNGSTLSGTLAYTKALGLDAARLFADLSAPALELDSLPDFSAIAQQTKAMDLALRFEAQAVKLGGIEQGEIDAGRIVLKFDRTGSDAKLENLAVSGIDGADLTASGEWGGTGGKIAVKLDAERLDSLLGLLRRFAPGPAVDFLVARAADFSPAHLDLGADAKITGNTLGLNGFSLAGTAGQTKISGKADPDPQKPGNFNLSLHLDAKDSTALLHQIGFSTLPLKGIGAGSIELTAQGGGRHLDTSVAALLAGTNFAFHGSVDPDLSAPQATGTGTLSSADLSSLMRATALALPDLATRLPANVSAGIDAGGHRIALSNLAGTFGSSKIAGHLAYDSDKGVDGALAVDAMPLADIIAFALGPQQQPNPGALWSDRKFAPADISVPPMHLAMSVAKFDLWPQISGEDAHFDLAIAGSGTGLEFGIHHLAMKIGAGSVDADLTLRRNGTSAAAESHVRLRDCELDLPSARGLLSADLDLAGTGDSPAALVAGFAGSGSIGFSDLILPKSDAGAMARVFSAVEDDQLSIDEAEIDRVLLTEFDKQPLSLGNAEFDAGLAAGVLRLSQKETETVSGVTENLQVAVDLRDLTLDQSNLLSLAAVPKNWNGALPQVTLGWKGSLANPTQTLDAANFVNALAARAIARQSARIEAQEFDVYEHAFFLSRLQSERQREAERLQAEDDARHTAELEQLKKAEAARAEQNADDVKSQTSEPVRNPRSPTPVSPAPMQIGRPTPMPPPRPELSAPATTPYQDPSAAGRY